MTPKQKKKIFVIMENGFVEAVVTEEESEIIILDSDPSGYDADSEVEVEGRDYYLGVEESGKGFDWYAEKLGPLVEEVKSRRTV